ncbi:predicted protein [Naegleria gruberi]|uniref:Predicted protein n=1 Tax=Naegleria gruberi TaxID=5762 RepID=D2VV04_NAEGR|nr:uncharacterized protein NAEGRDRAFT_72846 [Naegleria gruberi]EFC39355.1 predicted protein [Naegleria gruberi]|eukprot:XP_002672099.1 predicted protein [Naegleria gruberi strain NEG-M]
MQEESSPLVTSSSSTSNQHAAADHEESSSYNNNTSTPTLIEEDYGVYKKQRHPIIVKFLQFKQFYQSEKLRKVRRWIAFVIGAAMMIAAGTQYAFSSISPSLKKRFDLTQTEVNTIGTAANLGTNFSFLFSLVNDFLGARSCSFVSGAFLFGSYFLMALTVSGAIPGAENYIALSAFMFIMGNSSGGAYTAAMTTSVKNFPERNRGLVVGVLASFFGISSAIYSGSYQYIFQLQLQPYMIFCAVLGGIVVLILGTVFLDGKSSADKNDAGKKVSTANTINSSQQEATTTSEEGKPIVVDPSTGELPAEQTLESTTMMEEDTQTYEEDELREKLQQLEIPNVNSLKMLISLDFWLAFLVIFIVVGSGITVINNLGSLVLAYGGYNGQQNMMVIVFSICNCLGRLLFGILSDKLLSPKRGITRITFLSICIVMMTVIQFLFAVMPLEGFYPLIIFLGICYGGTYALTPTFNSERFGAKYFGMNSTIQSMAASLGSYAFSTGLAGYLYQVNIEKPRTLTCHGRPCYEATFYILSLLGCVALIISLILHKRTLWLYKTLYKRRHYATLLDRLISNNGKSTTKNI